MAYYNNLTAASMMLDLNQLLQAKKVGMPRPHQMKVEFIPCLFHCLKAIDRENFPRI
jgi:hypothetical protein